MSPPFVSVAPASCPSIVNVAPAPLPLSGIVSFKALALFPRAISPVPFVLILNPICVPSPAASMMGEGAVPVAAFVILI